MCESSSYKIALQLVWNAKQEATMTHNDARSSFTIQTTCTNSLLHEQYAPLYPCRDHLDFYILKIDKNGGDSV